MSPDRVPDRWLVIRAPRPDDPELTGLVVAELMELPVRGVVEEDDDLVVYLPAPEEEDTAEVIQAVTARIRSLLGDDFQGVAHHWQAHEAWEETWRQGLEPRRISHRIVVAPSWTDPALEPGQVLIVIDPGMAFGTAEHPTTRGCLRLLDRWVEPGQRIADVGAGSGILAIAAAQLGAEAVVALEMDPWACEAARHNARLNGVIHEVKVRTETVGPDFLPAEPSFDGIVANIEAGVLLPLLEGFKSGLGPEGWVILSGILESEADDILTTARSLGFEPAEEDREDGWWSGVLLVAGAATSTSGAPGG